MTGTVYTLITGPRACGKSTLGRVLEKLFNTNGVVFIDTSSIITWAQSQDTDFGRRLLDLAKERAHGTILPPEIVCAAISAWQHEIQRYRNLVHLIIAGSPRDETQCRYWKDNHHDKVRVIHIRSGRNEVDIGVRSRQKETKTTREDENSDAIDVAWNEYITKVVPGLDVFNGQVLHLDRRMPFMDQVNRAIDHIIASDGVKSRMNRRLSSPQHPARLIVDKITENQDNDRQVAT